MSDFYEPRTSEPDLREHIVKLLGGVGAVTLVRGRAIKANYISTGVVDLVWSENPGYYIGPDGFCFHATTPAQVKGYTMVASAWNVATKTLRINITSAADALVDLAALQWVAFSVLFEAQKI